MVFNVDTKPIDLCSSVKSATKRCRFQGWTIRRIEFGDFFQSKRKEIIQLYFIRKCFVIGELKRLRNLIFQMTNRIYSFVMALRRMLE